MSGSQEQTNKKILQSLQEQREKLKMKEQHQRQPESRRAGPVASSRPEYGRGVGRGKNLAQQRAPAPAERADAHRMLVNQRAALQHAQSQSYGCYVTQDSQFGNLILPSGHYSSCSISRFIELLQQGKPTPKMIHSLFMINQSGDIFMEKHWRSTVSRSVCDYFFEAQAKASRPEDVPVVVTTPHHYLVTIFRFKLYFVAVLQNETPPLYVVEFLHRIMDTFVEYFGSCSELVIKEQYVVVYELLDEMLDNGYPHVTDPNVLREMIRPPTVLGAVVDTVTGRSRMSETLPTGQLSNIPWRRQGVKYANNEAYFDLVEEIDAIIDKSGTTISSEIQGHVESVVKLSGMPDLTMSFVNPRLLDDVSFHPCVRFRRWEAERVLSFVPPDGRFRLMSYHITSSSVVTFPVWVKPMFHFREGSGSLDISVGPKQTMGKQVEEVELNVVMPKMVQNCTLTPTVGNYLFDPTTKTLKWHIGRLMPQKLIQLKGSLTLQTGAPLPDSNPSVEVAFKVPSFAVSGLKVNRLDIYGEKYKPFKGVKYTTKAGKFQVRS
ncbi:AP-3 complex subunit mu-1-like [Oscarella lobularis]|uniref:AP-3 complex subunit mu-1-like n=1 Tax=Oscarella lobularis TaxID=121494 RepID=UPI003313B68C